MNSLNCTVLTKENEPAELHLFTRGDHGHGLRPTEEPVTHWPDLAAKWLTDMGLTQARTK